jgi:protocatechuate 3,4-dioxygenase beta subunit
MHGLTFGRCVDITRPGDTGMRRGRYDAVMPKRRARLAVVGFAFAIPVAIPVVLRLATAGARERASAPPSIEEPAAPEAAPPPPVQVALAPPVAVAPATFEGHVLSTGTGAPIPGAELTFSRGDAAELVRAGPDGAFLFTAHFPGRWLLAAVAAPGYFPFAPEWGFSPLQFDALPGQQVRGVDVFLAPALELDGAVVDEDGAPVPDAEVTLLGGGGRALILIPDHFVADESGRFQAAAPQGSVLEARRPGYYPGHALVDLLSVVNGRVRIVLGSAWAGDEPARAALTGRVVTEDRRPVADALVEARQTRGWAYDGATVAQAVTDADGRFRLVDLDPSPHQLSARAEGYTPTLLRRVLPGGPDAQIVLTAGGRLRGCVRDGETGTSVAPFTVLAYDARDRLRSVPDQQASVADASGCFTLDALPPGTVDLVVLAPRYAPAQVAGVEVPSPPAQGQVEVTLAAGGVVTGTVRDEESGAPISGARVTAEPVTLLEDGRVPVHSTVAETTTGDDGSFVVNALPCSVRLHAYAAGHHPGASAAVDVPSGGVIWPVVIGLRPMLEGDSGPVDPVGIGAVLMPEGDGLAIGGLRPGSAAEASGLVPGDELLEIDEHPVSELGLGGAVEALRGPEGTPVFLLVRRGVTEFQVTVPRQRKRG